MKNNSLNKSQQLTKAIFYFSLFSFHFSLSMAQTQDVTVMEFHPAPGQFVNTMPEYEDGDTESSICQKATEDLADGNILCLGTYGGYMTVKFDHAIQNKPGSDFRVKGNGFYSNADPAYGSETIGGSFEPGIVEVGVGNSPKTAKWYELAGSEYYTTEVHDFTIHYFKPTSEPTSSLDNYIRWEATWTENGVRKDSTGYHAHNPYHKQSYWPSWEKGDTLTFHGGKLPNNAIDQSGKGTYWVLYRYAKDSYGYADASLNTDEYSTFDIDWAVDSLGNRVELPEINFIRVKTGLFQYCGWLGETSTEVAGFEDLHLVDGYDANPIVLFPPCATPSVSYENGRLNLACATDGASYHYTIATANNNEGETSASSIAIQAPTQYSVAVYATADGHSHSSTVTTTIDAVAADVNHDGKITPADANEVINMYLGKE